MIEVLNLACRAGDQEILRGVSFSVSSGIAGIIGPNGSGKSTLFNCMSGFFPVSSGHIRLLGSEVTHTPPAERARLGLGRVFQNFGIFRELTVLDNMLLALEGRDGILDVFVPFGKRRREQRDIALGFLARVKLEDRATARAGELSGGQLRLLEIVRTVAFGARVILLDEPTAGVSPRMKDEVSELVVSMRDEGKVILIIEHDIDFIYGFCERILVLNEGVVVLDGTPEQVVQSEGLREIYFGRGMSPRGSLSSL